MPSSSNSIRQAAVIAVRAGRVCLVQSSGGKRWVIPKGHIARGHTAAETALCEAWEEAGLLGRLRSEPVGSYLYQKDGRVYHVTVFLMSVTEAVDDWPERARRPRCWLRPAQALARVEHAGLCKLLRKALLTEAVELSPDAIIAG
jgi:8-oxo-dGTP pyrophosphatase MutT (NUDIX family)